jgi:(E)-4-hydroxy-3-methylbut-2-enyl-diphosphate synthase
LIKPYNDRLQALAEPQPERIQVRLSQRPDDDLDVPEARHPYEYARRPAAVVDIGGVKLGGSYPVRVELAPRAPLTETTALTAEIEALTRPGRPDQPVCEIIQLTVEAEPDIDRCIAVAQALRARGLTVPLAAMVSAELPGLTRLLPHVAKLNVSLVPARTEAQWLEPCPALIAAVQTVGGVLQWDVNLDAFPAPSIIALARLCQTHAFGSYLLAVEGTQTIPAYRLLAAHLAAACIEAPLTLRTPRLAADETLLRASLTLGSLLCDGVGDAIEVVSDLPAMDALRLNYNILQGARRRISKTEFISCPSCGRTQFDLETTTQRIKSQTSHLTGVKVAIMGCIVNGPGEMADADFGYVGSGPGKINLYVGKACVERNIPFHHADAKLIELIKTHGKWVDPA